MFCLSESEVKFLYEGFGNALLGKSSSGDKPAHEDYR
jgi:hypothetical protein